MSAAHVVLLVGRLAADAEGVGDRLPGPTKRSGVVHVELLELLDQLPQGRYCPEAGGGVTAVDGGVEVAQSLHTVNLG
jgi:hypothetical protein